VGHGASCHADTSGLSLFESSLEQTLQQLGQSRFEVCPSCRLAEQPAKFLRRVDHGRGCL
jgi:hypothetical protein